MVCIARSNERPEKVRIEHRENIYDVFVREDEHEVETEEGTEWEYREAYMQSEKYPEETDPEKLFEIAEPWTEPKEKSPEERIAELEEMLDALVKGETE